MSLYSPFPSTTQLTISTPLHVLVETVLQKHTYKIDNQNTLSLSDRYLISLYKSLRNILGVIEEFNIEFDAEVRSPRVVVFILECDVYKSWFIRAYVLQ